MDLDEVVRATCAQKEELVARAGYPTDLLTTLAIFEGGEVWAAMYLDSATWMRDLGIAIAASHSDPAVLVAESYAWLKGEADYQVMEHYPSAEAAYLDKAPGVYETILISWFSRTEPSRAVALPYTYREDNTVEWLMEEHGEGGGPLMEVVKFAWDSADEADREYPGVWQFPHTFLRCLKDNTNVDGLVILRNGGDVMGALKPEMYN